MNPVLQSIGEWKLEAKLEDSKRYFYHVRELEQIKSGSKAYVIGRKGTGKTAICEHICQIQHPKVFTEKLSFKNFPFNALYEYADKLYTNPNQYITIWKYIIYSFVLRMFLKNEGLDGQLRLALEKLYGASPLQSLRRLITGWTATDFSISIFGTGGKLGRKQTNTNQGSIPWSERADILEDVILQYIDDSKYYIVFDELDEDYKNIIELEQNERYTSLMTGLFKAVQEIKSLFPGSNAQIAPVIFLRDDIYDLLQDSDKNKWSDLRVDLDWDAVSIKSLLAFRIARSSEKDADPGKISRQGFGHWWNAIFSGNQVAMGRGGRKRLTVFNYISRSTHLRPRDFVHYLQACAESSMQRGDKQIETDTVKRCDKAFSNYLRQELTDEIRPIISDIEAIFDLFSHMRVQIFPVERFHEAFKAKAESGAIQTNDFDTVLRLLFHFSVIGNQPSQHNAQVFRYLNKEARINLKESLVIHRGLFKALQII